MTYHDALLLYVGILTDTGSFRYPNTSKFTHEVIADLMRFNISVSKIYQRIYESNVFSDALLLIKVFSTLQRHRGGKIVWMELTADMLASKSIRVDQTENILNFARAIKGVEVVFEEPELRVVESGCRRLHSP